MGLWLWPLNQKPSWSNIKAILTFFFKWSYCPPWARTRPDNNQGVLHQVLCRLRDMVRRKRPQLWASGDWWLCHDNVPSHSSALVLAFLEKHRISQVCQSPCSPDLAPCDFWLFPKLKSTLKGRRFVNVMVTRYTSSINSVSPLTD